MTRATCLALVVGAAIVAAVPVVAAGPGAGAGGAGSGSGGRGPAGSAKPAVKPIDLLDTPAEITVPPSWTVMKIPQVEAAPVAAYQSPAGSRVVITRAAAHNPQAWIERTRNRYADEVETGVAGATEGYKRKARTVLKVNGVPCMDLELSRTVDGVREDVAMRFVFFRTYTLTVAATGAKRDRSAIAAIVRSFGPPKGYIP